jgi:predicted secreted protein
VASLPNADLGDYVGTTTTPEFGATNSITGEGTVAVAKDSISMRAKVEIQLLFTGDISAYTAIATVGGENAAVTVDTETYAEYGWTMVKVAVSAAKMRDTYTIALYDAEGNPVTQVYDVSVEAYGAAQVGGQYNDVVIAMMRYGDSVAAL